MCLINRTKHKITYVCISKNATNDNIIKRAGTANEVAKAIIFAIENEFITGTTIDIDGGWILS